jgi:hypothetical protein
LLAERKSRYFETERDAWVFLTDCDRAEIGKIAA